MQITTLYTDNILLGSLECHGINWGVSKSSKLLYCCLYHDVAVLRNCYSADSKYAAVRVVDVEGLDLKYGHQMAYNTTEQCTVLEQLYKQY